MLTCFEEEERYRAFEKEGQEYHYTESEKQNFELQGIISILASLLLFFSYVQSTFHPFLGFHFPLTFVFPSFLYNNKQRTVTQFAYFLFFFFPSACIIVSINKIKKNSNKNNV